MAFSRCYIYSIATATESTKMKPSHLTTPRQMSDCTFTVGCPEVRRSDRRASDIVILMIGCTVASLLIAGVL